MFQHDEAKHLIGVHINCGGGQDDGLKDEIDQKGDAESMANIVS